MEIRLFAKCNDPWNGQIIWYAHFRSCVQLSYVSDSNEAKGDEGGTRVNDIFPFI